MRLILDDLRAAGHVVTHDWTVCDDSGLAGAALAEYHARCAFEDLEGVRRADAVVVLPHPDGKGLYCELGAALALGKPIIVVGDALDCHTIFLRHPLCRWVATDEEIVPVLESLAAQARAAGALIRGGY